MSDGGVRLYGVNGHVKKPCVVELAVGPTLNELIYDVGGGVLGDRGVLCVIPGGSSTPVLRPEETVNAPDPKAPLHAWHGKSVFDVPLGVETMRGVGTMLGTCCVTVIAEGTDPVVVHAEPDAVLPPRVVRAVHAVPRGQRVARPRLRQAPRGQAPRWRSSTAARHRERHHGQHHLRVRRGDGHARARLHAEVPQGVRGLRARRAEARGREAHAWSPGAEMAALGTAYFYVCALLAVGGAAVGRRGEEPDPRRDGAPAPHPERRGALPRAARAVPRGDPAHRLRGRHRRPVPLRHHAPRAERVHAARSARPRGARLRRRPLRPRGLGEPRARGARRRAWRTASCRCRFRTRPSAGSTRSAACSSPTRSCRSSSRARFSWSPSSAPSPSPAGGKGRTRCRRASRRSVAAAPTQIPCAGSTPRGSSRTSFRRATSAKGHSA